MPRTAPTIDGSPNYYEVSLSYVDAHGDKRSDSIYIPAVSYDDIAMEALVAKIATMTNANLYQVSVTAIYGANPLASAATDAVIVTAQSNIVMLAKSVYKDTVRAFIPAPVESLFVAGTETPDAANADLLALQTLWLAATGYTGQASFVSLRYSQRSEINEKVQL